MVYNSLMNLVCLLFNLLMLLLILLIIICIIKFIYIYMCVCVVCIINGCIKFSIVLIYLYHLLVEKT